MATKRMMRSIKKADDENDFDEKSVKVEKSFTESSALPLDRLQKIFFISKEMLKNDQEQLIMEKFYHPGKGTHTYFMTQGNNLIMEILQYNDPYRCWLVDDDICSDGRIYFTTPIDATFLALPHLRKHCYKNAMALNHIVDDNNDNDKDGEVAASVHRLMTCFVNPEHLKCVTDVKTLDDINYFKYNHEKTLKWLKVKTMRVVRALKESHIYCGQSARSQNYVHGLQSTDEIIRDDDYLRYACEYVGNYLSMDLYEELTKYLKIPPLSLTASVNNNKRKSDNMINNESADKKQKLSKDHVKYINSSKDDSTEDLNESNNEDDKQQLKDIIMENQQIKSKAVIQKKERILNAKEKSLAKGAKGTKNIASFFTKAST